jgi:hypothetical protein
MKHAVEMGPATMIRIPSFIKIALGIQNLIVEGVRFPALSDFLRSSGSGTGSTQPREDN